MFSSWILSRSWKAITLNWIPLNRWQCSSRLCLWQINTPFGALIQPQGHPQHHYEAWCECSTTASQHLSFKLYRYIEWLNCAGAFCIVNSVQCIVNIYLYVIKTQPSQPTFKYKYIRLLNWFNRFHNSFIQYIVWLFSVC